MTRKELREHCEKEIEMCEFWAIGKGEKPSGKIYEEHKLILELLDQESVLDKVRVELIQAIQNGTLKIETGNEELFRIIDKYKTESEDKE